MGILMDSIGEWRHSKTISQTNLFEVTFEFPTRDVYTANGIPEEIQNHFIRYITLDIGDLISYNDFGKFIKPWHILNVGLPMNSQLSKANQSIGMVPNTFPIFEKTDGYEINLTMEDDKDLTITKFLQYMFKRCVRADGLHWPPAFNKSVQMTVKLYDKSEQVQLEVQCYGVYLLSSTPIQLSYSNNESVKYDVTLNCDEITYKYK